MIVGSAFDMMPRRWTALSRWLLLASLLCCSSCQSVPSSSSSFENKTGSNESRPRVFSPRMDYDEWTPLGRGDPLKNNPTFDYVPPVLDRVQYWLDSHTTEPSAKRDILVLGVTAKKTSPKIPDQFFKFVDGPKFTRTNQDSSYRNEFTGSTGAEPPKLVRTTSFRNGLVDYRNQNRIQALPASYYPSPYYTQKNKPYTMMLPPPMVQKPVDPSTTFNSALTKDKVLGYGDVPQQFSTQTEEGPVLQETQFYGLPSKPYSQHHQPLPTAPPRSHAQTPKSPAKGSIVSQVETIKSVYSPSSSQATKTRYEGTTPPSVSFEKSNLIYQSTQTLTGGWLGNNGPTASSTTADINHSSWQTPDYSRDRYEVDHRVSASSNHEVVIGQNANIIVDGDSNENEEVVIGQKEVISSDVSTGSGGEAAIQISASSVLGMDTKENSEGQVSQKMHIVVANSPVNNGDLETHKAKKGPVAVVMPSNYMDKKEQITSQHPESSSVLTISSENPTTTEKSTSQQVSISQSMRHPVTGSSMIVPDDPMTPSTSSNRLVPSQIQLPHPPSPPLTPSRHVNPTHTFPGSQPPSQAALHSQSRPMHMMPHFMTNMRPGLGFRPSSSIPMSHMSPPMAHMHAPIMKTMMGPPSMNIEQFHKRPPQVPTFQMSFTSPPIPTTLEDIEGERPFDRYHSRLPDTAMLTTTLPPVMTSFSPTASSPASLSVLTEFQGHSKVEQSPLLKILNDEESLKRDTVTSSSPSVSSAPSSSSSSSTSSSTSSSSSFSSSSPPTLAPQTTTVPSLTTDPIFSHYKQPAKPIRGPMYLIIQGHSKVKTYKPTVNKHGVPVENNEIIESVTERELSKLEQLIRENTKKGNSNVEKMKQQQQQQQQTEKKRMEKLAMSSRDNLMSIVESGLGGFTLAPTPSSVTEEERQTNAVTSIEINGN